MLNELTHYNKKEKSPQIPLLYDVQHLDSIKITGKDVLPFLHRIATSNIKNLTPNKVCQTIFANDKGRIIDVVHIAYMTDFFLVICNKLHRENLIAWIKKYTILEDVNVHAESEYSFWQVWNLAIAVSSNYLQETPYGYSFSWSSPSGTPSTWLVVPHCQKQQIAQNLTTHFPHLHQWEQSEYEYYRIAHQIPHAPNELNDSINPHEANLTYLIDFKKGCYIGQEVIARLDTYDKVKKHLRLFRCEKPIIFAESMEIITEEKQVAGYITSFSSGEENIGLAYVLRKFLDFPVLYLPQETGILPLQIYKP